MTDRLKATMRSEKLSFKLTEFSSYKKKRAVRTCVKWDNTKWTGLETPKVGNTQWESLNRDAWQQPSKRVWVQTDESHKGFRLRLPQDQHFVFRGFCRDVREKKVRADPFKVGAEFSCFWQRRVQQVLDAHMVSVDVKSLTEQLPLMMRWRDDAWTCQM